MASSTGFERQSGWSFADIPEDQPPPPYFEPTSYSEPPSPTPTPSSPSPLNSRQSSRPSTPPPTRASPAGESRQTSQQRTYPPRTCRICFDVVHPIVDLPNENIPGFLQSDPQVRYESAADEGGRLIRPCLCKGTSKYVHEGCLNQWRLANPNNARNYYECPTCKFKYRLERLRWAEYVQSTVAELSLTFLIFFVSIFLLGFIADPIINLYLDPPWAFKWIWNSEPLIPERARGGRPVEPDWEPDTWFEHFLKGFASLGLLSFVKLIFTAPLQWIRLGRWDIDLGGGRGVNRPGARGRDRVAELSWIVIVIGVITFFYTVFKVVRAWSRRTLNGLGSRVLDVQADAGDEDEDEDVGAEVPQVNTPETY